MAAVPSSLRPRYPLPTHPSHPIRRHLGATPVSRHGKVKIPEGAETVDVVFINRDGTETPLTVPVGMNLLEAAHQADVELEGACEGSVACSTCHVIIEQKALFDALPEADEDEEDMLDLAYGLTGTSRLGCQVVAAKELDGLRARIPSATRNMAVDGFVPKPH